MSPRDLSRREALGLMAGAAALAAARPALAADNGVNPRFVWEPTNNGDPVVATTGTGQQSARMFPTLLPMGHLIPNAIDAWYLWAWHHDSYPQLHVYTAPKPEGPYTSRYVFNGPPAPGYPSNYVRSHFSSGDIVWDAANQRLVCSPHSVRLGPHHNGEPCQDSFLIESADGLTWTFLDGDNSPRLLCGNTGDIDSVHTGYGRLLRDLDGNLATFQDRYWWLYRAQRHDAGDNKPTFYVPALASTPSLSAYPWTKHGRVFTMTSQDTGLFGIGAFLRAANRHWACYGEGSAVLAPTAQWLDGSEGLSMTWTSQGTPVPVPNPSATLVTGGGANIVRDPVSRVQYLVQDSIDLVNGGSQIRVYKSVVP